MIQMADLERLMAARALIRQWETAIDFDSEDRNFPDYHKESVAAYERELKAFTEKYGVTL